MLYKNELGMDLCIDTAICTEVSTAPTQSLIHIIIVFYGVKLLNNIAGCFSCLCDGGLEGTGDYYRYKSTG